MDKIVLRKVILIIVFSFLYSKTNGQVNMNAPVISIDSILINSPVHKVWETLYDEAV
jgi:hypothetical protein